MVNQDITFANIKVHGWQQQLFYNVWVVVTGNFGKQWLTATKTIWMTNTDMGQPKMEKS